MQVRTAEPKHNSRAALPISDLITPDLITTGLSTVRLVKRIRLAPCHTVPLMWPARGASPSLLLSPGTEIEPYALARRAMCVIQSMRPT